MAQKNPESVEKVNKFFDEVKHALNIRHDVEFGKQLGLLSTQVAHLRSGRAAFGPSIILRFHEKLGMAVADIRKALG
jgi:hypothetical protein